MAASLTPVAAVSGTGLAQAIAGEPVKILLVDDQPGRLLTYRAILEPRCGAVDDSQPVQQNNGTLGVTTAFVLAPHSAA